MKTWPLFSLLFLLSVALSASPLQARLPQQAPSCTTASPNSDPNVGPSLTVCVSTTYHDLPRYTATVVSWVSGSAETGRVNLVGQGPVNDVRGDSFVGKTHYVELANLVPNTGYQFDVISGGRTFSNGGQHWSIQTGPTLTPSRANAVLGAVKNPDGTQANGGIVYVTVQRTTDQAASQLLSQLITPDDAGFSIPLGNARAVDGSKFDFVSTRDKVIITATGEPGFTSTTVNISVALPPQPSPPNVSLTLGAGYVTSATATPSPIPPTSTGTPVTPTLTQTLMPGTATVVAQTQTALAYTETPTMTVPPSATRPLPAATSTTAPSATLLPTLAALETETQVAEATIEANAGTPEPTSLRVGLPTPATSPAGSLTRDLALNLVVLAAVAAIGIAVLLAVAAIWIWKR